MFNYIQAQWSEKTPIEIIYCWNDIVETLGTLRTPENVMIGKLQKQK